MKYLVLLWPGSFLLLGWLLVALENLRVPWNIKLFVTNGSTMTADLAKRLWATGIQEISISLDGLESFHNQMRGVPNAFEKGWKAMDPAQQ